MNRLKTWGSIVSLTLLLIYLVGRISGAWPVSNTAGTLILLAAYGALQTLSSLWANQQGVIRELPRKLMHLGNGAVWMCLPWLFDNPWPPTFVALSGVAWFVLLRSRALQKTSEIALASQVYRTRSSVGDVFFSSAFALTFHLSHHDPLTYLAAATVLTFGDGLAAVVGVCWGSVRFRTTVGLKSLEGVAACFTVSWAAVVFGLSPHALQPSTLLCVSALIALALVLIELTTPFGIDNLLLPLSAWGMMKVAAISSPVAASWLAGAISTALLCWLIRLNWRVLRRDRSLTAADVRGQDKI